MDKNITQAVEILKNGGIGVFPTDTAFGVGCRMDDPKAVEKLFRIRRRPETQAAPVLVNSIEMAQRYLLRIPDDVKKIMQKHWPGALTVILPCQPRKASPFVRGGGLNLGVRMPNHEIPLELIKGVGVPILGPSANFHGQSTPYKMEDLDKEFLKLVDFVLPGECSVGLASTVIDCSTKPWKIVRQGAVKIDETLY